MIGSYFQFRDTYDAKTINLHDRAATKINQWPGFAKLFSHHTFYMSKARVRKKIF